MTVSQNESFFDFDGNRPWDSLLALQIDPSAPAVAGAETGTGLVLPDTTVASRLRHLPDDLYDLRDTSHLMRFMQALLGESGVGGMRKRNIVAQFQSAMQGANFYDLDRFYGAIFSIYRFASEVIAFDPYSDTATQNEWDTVEDADASFRDRISRLASAINLGGTVPGIKQAAEAITLVECEVFESWSIMDLYGSGAVGNTWSDMTDLGTWGEIEALEAGPDNPTWSDLASEIPSGRSGSPTRSEITVWPKKDYDAIAARLGAAEAQRQKAQDEESLVSILSVIKPASTLLTIDTSGISTHSSVSIAHVWSPSSLWEVAEIVTPHPDYDESVYPLSPGQIAASVDPGSGREIPRPAWQVNDSAEWTHNADVVGAQSYALDEDDQVIEQNIYYMVARTDGTLNTFSARRGLMDPRRAHASRMGKEGSVSVAPYAGDREVATPLD